jgi:ferredoxin
MPKVKVDNRPVVELDVQQGRTLLMGAKEADVAWRAYCGGLALCGTCAVIVVDGAFDKPTETEGYFIEGWGYHPGYRLACQARVVQDVTVVNCADLGFEQDKVLAAWKAACDKLAIQAD